MLRKIIKYHTPVWLYKFFSFIWNIPVTVKRWFKKPTNNFTSREFRNIEVGPYNFTILLDPNNGYVDNKIYLDGEWEVPLTNKIVSTLKDKDGIFIDVGANIGYFTLLSGLVLKGKGEVHGYEPISYIFKQLQTSIKKNDLNNVKVFNLACGSEDKYTEINIFRENVGSSSLLSETKLVDKVEQVKVVRLDDRYQDKEKIILIKIDVEGYEIEVLKGAQKILTEIGPEIVFEFNPYRLADIYGQDKVCEVLYFLQESGYGIYTLRGEPITNFQTLAENQIRLRESVELCCKK